MIFSRIKAGAGVLAFLVMTALIAQPAMAAKQSVEIDSVIARGAKPLNEEIEYRVIRMDGEKRGEIVTHHRGPKLAMQVPSGRYRIFATYRDTTIAEEVAVGSAPLHHEMNFNAGWVGVKLIPTLKGAPVQGDIHWQVWTHWRNKKGERMQVADTRGSTPSFVLPEGYYVVIAKHDGVEIKHTIEVAAGNSYDYSLNMDAGTMRVFSEPVAGTDPNHTIWEVYPAGSEGRGEPLTTREAKDGSFTLREGEYVLIGRNGDKTVRKVVQVRAGKVEKVSLKF